MKQQICILAIFLWTAFSCVNNSTNAIQTSEIVLTETLSEDDYKLINATFPHLVVIPFKGAEREFGYNNFNPKKGDIPDENFKNVYFTSALVPLTDSNAFSIRPFERFNIEDTTIQKLYKRLFTDGQSELILETDSITNTSLWKLKPVFKGQKTKMAVGERRITYSRIIYDAEHKFGIFYFQNECHGMCGFGKFVVVEKINGIWTIIKEYDDWIS